jgi:hypothetical protein
MPLTDMEVRSAKPGARLIKLSDGGGACNYGSPQTVRSAGGSPIDLQAGKNCSPSASIQRPVFARRARRGKRLSGSMERRRH